MIDNDLELIFKDRVIRHCSYFRLFPLKNWLLQTNELLQEIFTIMLELHKKDDNRQDDSTISFVFDRQFIKNEGLKQMIESYRELVVLQDVNKAFKLLTKNVESRFFNGMYCNIPIIFVLQSILTYEGRKIYFDAENLKANGHIISFFNDIEFYTFLHIELGVEKIFVNSLPVEIKNVNKEPVPNTNKLPKTQKESKLYIPLSDEKKAYYLSIAKRYNVLVGNMSVADATKMVFKEFRIKKSTLYNSLIYSKL